VLRFASIANAGSFDFEKPLLVEIDTTFDDDTAKRCVIAEILRAAGRAPDLG